MSQTYSVFYSPTVTKRATLDLLKTAFSDAGIQASFHPVANCTEYAARAESDILVAAGGDGTVNCVAQAAYKYGKPLGVVPLGTLNHFAKDLGLPLVLVQAVKILGGGKTAKVDTASVNDLIFLNNCSVGLYPTIVRSRVKLERLIGKWPAAIIALILVVARRLHMYPMIINLPKKTLEKSSSLLFVGNNIYHEDDIGLPSRDTLRGGELHAFCLKTKRIDRLMLVGLLGILGRKLPEKYIERFNATEFTVHIAGRRQLWLAYDGEITRVHLPLKYTIHPRSLEVIVA
jgi:diacylglycerol kinase family enzyme